MEPIDISVILPCYNERDNILLIIARLLQVLAGSVCEFIVVDDNSPDGTAQLVRAEFANDPRIRLIVRTRERGDEANLHSVGALRVHSKNEQRGKQFDFHGESSSRLILQ